MLSGYKTYLSALAMVAFGLGGAFIGEHDWNSAMGWILQAAALAGLRNGIGNLPANRG